VWWSIASSKPEGQLLELTHDASDAPSDVLPREPKDQVPRRLGEPWPTDPPRLTVATLLPLPPAVGHGRSAVGLDADDLQGMLDRIWAKANGFGGAVT